MTTADLYPSEHLYPSDNLFPGNHHLNAIDKHQNPNRYNEYDFKNNSAYLSTTPHFERAKYYATQNNKLSGYVFWAPLITLIIFALRDFLYIKALGRVIAKATAMSNNDDRRKIYKA